MRIGLRIAFYKVERLKNTPQLSTSDRVYNSILQQNGETCMLRMVKVENTRLTITAWFDVFVLQSGVNLCVEGR